MARQHRPWTLVVCTKHRCQWSVMAKSTARQCLFNTAHQLSAVREIARHVDVGSACVDIRPSPMTDVLVILFITINVRYGGSSPCIQEWRQQRQWWGRWGPWWVRVRPVAGSSCWKYEDWRSVERSRGWVDESCTRRHCTAASRRTSSATTS